MQVSNDHDNGDAPPCIRKYLIVTAIVIVLVSFTAYPCAIWYEPSVACQENVRFWISLNIFPALFVAWLVPFKATLRRTIWQRIGFFLSVASMVTQVGLGCYVIASEPRIHCMIHSVNGGFTFALLILEASLLGSMLGVLSNGYRLY